MAFHAERFFCWNEIIYVPLDHAILYIVYLYARFGAVINIQESLHFIGI